MKRNRHSISIVPRLVRYAAVLPQPLPLLLLALLLLAACTADEQEPAGADAQVPVQLTVGQDTIGDAATRTTSNLYHSTSCFAVDETMKVFMKNGTTTTSQVYKVASVASNKATLTDNGTKLYYPAGTTGSVQLYAVYPSGITSGGTHTVAYDQTGDANYKKSDLMYSPAKTVNLSAKTTQQELSAFQHKLVRLKLNIIKDNSLTSITKIVMNNVKRKVTVSALSESAFTVSAAAQATGESGTGANTNELLVFSGENKVATQQTYYVVFPKQVASGNDWNGTNFLTVTADGATVTYKLTKTFTAGDQYELTLKVNKVALNTTIAITNWTDTQSATVNPTLSRVSLPYASVGMVIGSDGYAYEPDATRPSGVTKCAMVAYVGSKNSVDGTGPYSASLNHGLAIALGDVVSTAGAQQSTTPNTVTFVWSDAKTACSNYKGSKPSGVSDWMLPSVFQMERMLIGCGSSGTYIGDAVSMDTGNVDFDYGNIQTLLSKCGGYQFYAWNYWLSTERSTNNADAFWYQFISTIHIISVGDKSVDRRARPCFAF